MGDLTQNFSAWEFRCQCGCGKEDIDIELVDRLQLMRSLLGRGFTPTSGVRCVEHNRAEGGVENSTHVRCIAADIPYNDSVDCGTKLNAAISAGFRAIGFGRNFLHLDLREFDDLMVFNYYGADHVA